MPPIEKYFSRGSLKFLSITHHIAGHPGKERCLAQARLAYYWPTMKKDIDTHVDKCIPCARFKGHTMGRVPMREYPIPNKPFDTVAIDLLKLPRTEKGSEYLFVAKCHFSRFVVLVPLADKTANSVARTVVDHIICQFTTPKVLLSDNGAEFNNQVLEAICRCYGIKKANVLAYHPSSNGLVERQNRRVLEVLRQLPLAHTMNWDDWINQ